MANAEYVSERDYDDVAGELQKLRESANDLLNFVDMSDSMTFHKDDGTPQAGLVYNQAMAFGQALMRPSATACAYINEQHLRMLRARSRAFCSLNPYWMAVRENKIAYAIGTGHILSICPRRKGKDVGDDMKWKVLDELERFQKVNKYRRRQGEKLTRLDRDGEHFLRFHDQREDGVLRVRFIEPLLVQNPPGMGPEQNVWFGIQFDGDDYEEPLGYYIRPATYDGRLNDRMNQEWSTMVPAAEMQHRTVNVDLGSPRGLPTTYTLQPSCEQAVSTLKSMGKLVDIRARIAVIVKQVNATLGQIQPLLNRNRVGQAQSGNRTLSVFGYPYGSILNTNDQRTYEFPSQHIETDKIVHSLKADLQSVAGAVGLADFTISADSAAAFANALVKEGPMDRMISRIQQDLIDDDTEVYERALAVAAGCGRLPDDILETVRIEIMPPNVIARERLVNTQADEILVRNKAMSPATMAMRANLDPEDEWDKSEERPSPQVVDPSGATGNTRSLQPGSGGGSTARGVPTGSEPGPGVNPRGLNPGKAEQ